MKKILLFFPEIPARLLLKTHIETYTRSDGTVVAAHEDARAKKIPVDVTRNTTNRPLSAVSGKNDILGMGQLTADLRLGIAGTETPMDKITYTVAADCPVAQLAGKTLVGGLPAAVSYKDPTIEGVDFPPQQGVKQNIRLRLAGKPDLQALVADYQAAQKAEQASKDAILSAFGWDQYAPISRNMENAYAAYQVASERGYPERAAAAWHQAEQALEQARKDFPGAAAYAKTLAYAEARNHQKSEAGRKAVAAIKSGADPVAAAAAMEAAWGAAAQRMVDNA